MPTILFTRMATVLKAVAALVGVGVGVMTAVNTIGFPINFYNGPTESTLPPTQDLVVEYGRVFDEDSCPTCRFVDANNVLLDYYGRPMDIQKLLDDTPTPTVPFKISFEAPLTRHPRPTPTPSTTPTTVSTTAVPASSSPPYSAIIPEPNGQAPGAFRSEKILFWLQLVLSWYMFPLANVVVHAMKVATPAITTSSYRELAVLFACRLACATFSRTVVTFIHYLHSVKVRRAKAASARANAKLRTRTDAFQSALLEKFMQIVDANLEDPATMESAMHRLMVEYVHEEEQRRQRWLDNAKRALKKWSLRREKKQKRDLERKRAEPYKLRNLDLLDIKFSGSPYSFA